MKLNELEAIVFGGKSLSVSADDRQKVESCYCFLKDFAKDKVIYGINTGFGPMAQYRVSDENLLQLQYNIIRSHSTGAGRPLPTACVKAAMVSRLCTFLNGKSGIHVDTITLLQEFINRDIIPVIPEHGSVGASGDLVQLAHLALALIGEGDVFYKGERRLSADVMRENGLTPLKMYLREGLAITNGTAVMTGIGLVNLIRAKQLYAAALLASVLVNEIVSSYDDFMADELNRLKNHDGQNAVAAEMRRLSAGSKCLYKRAEKLYNRHEEATFDHKVQPYYSLRCVPQILGPVLEVLRFTEKILVEELNAADDNPIVDPETRTVYHGGNFHGDYVSFEMDKLKIAVTKMTMLMERQMNYIFHDRINGILPPFVNLGVLGLNYGLQASQFTATSTTAECQTLSMPNYVHSIPNNNDNQDIVSMGTNSALICRRVVENAFQVMAIHYMALVQAVDCLKIADKLAPATRQIYDDVRAIVPVFIDDTPKFKEIEKLIDYLKDKHTTY
ncbi:MAG: histidine ammonia-lyase [Paludibacteraceae bacterium]